MSGYLLESVSLDFYVGGRNARDPVYVYLQEDNGSGGPNHNQGGQVAVLTKAGFNFAGPNVGVNKYFTYSEKNAC